MSTQRQKNAAWANGRLSKGPITPEGKARSSKNAIRHGFLSQMVVTGAEVGQGVKEIVDQHLERYGGLDGVEFGMIEEMAVAYWRMRRIWTIEKQWLDEYIAAHPNQDATAEIAAAFGHLAESDKYKVLHRYESRMHRIYQKSLQTLRDLRIEHLKTKHLEVTLAAKLTPPAEK